MSEGAAAAAVASAGAVASATAAAMTRHVAGVSVFCEAWLSARQPCRVYSRFSHSTSSKASSKQGVCRQQPCPPRLVKCCERVVSLR